MALIFYGHSFSSSLPCDLRLLAPHTEQPTGSQVSWGLFPSVRQYRLSSAKHHIFIFNKDEADKRKLHNTHNRVGATHAFVNSSATVEVLIWIAL